MRRRAKAERLESLAREVGSLRAAIALLHRISHLVVAALELEPTCYAVLTGLTAGAGLGLDRAMIFLLDGEGRCLRGRAAIGPFDRGEARKGASPSIDLAMLYALGLRHRDSPGRLDRRVREVTFDVEGSTPVALSFRRGALVVAEGTDDASGLFHVPTAIAAPFGDQRGLSGVLYADNCWSGRKLDAVSRMVFGMVAEDAGRAIDNARRYEQVATLSRTDALTGLGHHGALMADLDHEASVALAEERSLGVVMIDLDGFKRINDELGHLSGDALLTGLSSRMRRVVRGGEGIYRFGGDEFAALLPGADRRQAAVIAERLRRVVCGEPFSLGERGLVPVACSLGVAALPEDARDPQRLIEIADEALRRAKAHGKNRVELSTSAASDKLTASGS